MFKQIQIHDLRVLQSINIYPSTGINLISGTNGAGKTSLLEAIYVLVHGKSFKYREIGPLIQEGKEYFQIIGKFITSDNINHQLGMKRTKNQLLIRFDGKSSIRRSEILSMLPISWIGSDPQSLLTDSPDVRRQFLDAGLFHVEPEYLSHLQNYYRALEQRNTALKQTPDQKTINSWNNALQMAAKKIDYWRSEHITKLIEEVIVLMNSWEQKVSLDIRYHRGWSIEKDLLSVFQETLETDKKLKYTTNGIHRADIVIKSSQVKSGKLLSRGQLKMLACAFQFAQARLLKELKKTSAILLFDDLAAELDVLNRNHLLTVIDQLYEQSFLTTLDASDFAYVKESAKMFHVEQGQISD